MRKEMVTQNACALMRELYYIKTFLNIFDIRGPFEKFVGSTYYSELELCGGFSFSKYIPWQAMHFLQRSTHFSKTLLHTVCRKLQEDSGTGSFLPRSSLFVVEKAQKSHGGEM
jgi:hypothetical protein